MNKILSMHPMNTRTSTSLQQYCCLNGTSKLSSRTLMLKTWRWTPSISIDICTNFYVVIEFTAEKCCLPPISMMKNALFFEFLKMESIWFKKCLLFPHAVPLWVLFSRYGISHWSMWTLLEANDYVLILYICLTVHH
jgi:hypothetical protein